MNGAERGTGDRTKLLGALVAILLLAFLTTSMASFFVSRKAIHESIVNRELPMTSDTIYSEIQNDLLKPLLISSTMANDTFLRDWVLQGEKNPAEIRNYLSEIKRKYGTFSSFFVSEQSRTYYYADGILKSIRADDPRDAWYFRVRDMNEPYEINVDPDLANRDAMTIFINFRVTDFDGNFIGATGVGLTVSMVKSRITNYDTRYGRNVFFVDTEGKVVLAPDGSDSDNRNILQMPGISAIAREVLDQRGSSFEYRRDGKRVLLNARYLPELRWHLLAEQVEDVSLRSLRQVLIFNLAICLIATLAVGAGIYRTVTWYQGRLERRYRELEEKNREIDSQRRRLERQSGELTALLREKDEFYSIVAHDLKAPLIGIGGLARLLREGEMTAGEARESVDLIIRSATDMTRLVKNLLDIHSIDAAPEFKAEAFDLCELVRAAAESFSFQARSKRIDLLVQLPAEAICIAAGRNWMETVVNNLLSNAIKFSGEQSAVTVAATRAGERVRLTVRDQGPGIAAEEQDRLFQRFSRLSTRATGGESSTGLGLYIVRQVVEQLGGTVVCESTPGHGATFIVDLPATSCAPPAEGTNRTAP